MISLVTGGAGFIGSHIVDKLLELGHHVRVIDNESGISNNKFYWNSNAENYKKDILDYKGTKKIYKNVDNIFHVAAQARVQPSINNPLYTINNNFLGTSIVLEQAKNAGIKRFIYSSTSSAYGNNLIPNIETQKDDYLNHYSVSKAAGENMCNIYNKLYGLETITLRYFNVYGDRQPLKGKYATVIGLFLKQKRNNKPLTVIGDGLQRRDFTHISDIVDANIKAMQINNVDFGGKYNVGTGKDYSIKEIAQTISKDIVYINKRPGEAKRLVANIDKIKKDFGWYPKIDLIEWINLMIYSNSKGE